MVKNWTTMIQVQEHPYHKLTTSTISSPNLTSECKILGFTFGENPTIFRQA